MISRDKIQNALGASRVVPLKIKNPHGPLGLEQLAEAVEQLVDGRPTETNQIQRPILLPLETWQKLDDLANKLTQDSPRHITASEVATTLVIQGIDAIGQS